MKRTLGILGAAVLTVGLITMTPTVAQAETSSSSPTITQSSKGPSVVPRNIKRNKQRCVLLARQSGTRCDRYAVNPARPCWFPGEFGYNSSGVFICIRDGYGSGLNMWRRY